VGLLLSLVGVLFDREKTAAWLGVAIGAIVVAFFLVMSIC
jgi:hypothetical protein